MQLKMVDLIWKIAKSQNRKFAISYSSIIAYVMLFLMKKGSLLNYFVDIFCISKSLVAF